MVRIAWAWAAELFAALHALEHDDVALIDVAQITIRGTLVLCAEVSGESLSESALRRALGERAIQGEGIGVEVAAVTPSADPPGRRLLVTMLAPTISAGQFERSSPRSPRAARRVSASSTSRATRWTATSSS